jgi:hypothetical protein
MALLPKAVKQYRRPSYYRYCRRVEPNRQNAKLTALDFAQALAAVSAAKITAKTDGSLPSKYIKLRYIVVVRASGR